MKKVLLSILLLWTSNLFAEGVYRNSTGTANDTVYFYGTTGDSLWLKPTAADSIMYHRYYQGTVFESSFVAWATDNIDYGSYRHAFVARRNAADTGHYAIRAIPYNNGNRSTYTFGEATWYRYEVRSDPKGDTVTVAGVNSGSIDSADFATDYYTKSLRSANIALVDSTKKAMLGNGFHGGANSALRLDSVRIVSSVSHAVRITGAGTGWGVELNGGSGGGFGLQINGGGSKAGMAINGGGNGEGLVITGAGTGAGVSIAGGGTSGEGVAITGSGGGIGLDIQSDGTGPAVQITGGTGHGVLIAGGNAAGSVGMIIKGGSTSGAAESLSVAAGTRTEAHVGAAAAEGFIYARLDSVEKAPRTHTTVGTATNVTTVNGLAANVITAASIADNAIDSTEIAAGTIDSSEIRNNAITAPKIANGAIDATAFAADAITTGAIASGAIGADEIQDDAITGLKIAAGAIGSSEIGSNAIDADAIAVNAIDNAEIAAGAFDTTQFAEPAKQIFGHRISAGTSPAVTSNTLQTQDAPSVDSMRGAWVYIASATTGAGQTRMAASYNTVTNIVSITPSWNPTPTGTVKYIIYSGYGGLDNALLYPDAEKVIQDSTTSGVWRVATSTHSTTAGSFGHAALFNDNTTGWAQTGAGGGGSCTVAFSTGTGVNTITFTTKDSANAFVVVDGVVYEVRDSTSQNVQARYPSDQSGRTTFSLNNGTYYVKRFKPTFRPIYGSNPSPQDSIYLRVTASASRTDTIVASTFTSPSPTGRTRVYGFIRDLTQDSLVNFSVTVKLSVPTGQIIRCCTDSTSPVIQSPVEKGVNIGWPGYWFIDVTPSDKYHPDAQYEFTFNIEGMGVFNKMVTVPDQSEWLFKFGP